MADIIIADGSDADIVAVAGDTVTLQEGDSFTGTISADTDGGDPVAVSIDGLFGPDDDPFTFAFAISLSQADPQGAGHTLIVGETGVLDQQSGVIFEGYGGTFENHGRIEYTTPAPGIGSTGVFIAAEGMTALNTGTIGGEGVDHTYGVGFAGPVVSPDPSLSGAGSALTNTGTISAELVGVLSDADDVVIQNAGEISAATAIGVESGARNTILNSGLLLGETEAGSADGIGVGLGDQGILRNSGTIAGGTGVWVTGPAGLIRNPGTITGAAHGILLDGAGASGLTIRNKGLVEATGDGGQPSAAFDGIAVAGESDDITLRNFDTILGAAGGVFLDGTGNLVVNSGTIAVTDPSPGNVAVEMIGGDAVFTNDGVVIGQVVFGGGDDVYDGRNGSAAGTIGMGRGADTATGGAGADTILGQQANDTLKGKAGADDLRGGGGDDDIRGGSGADILTGGGGRDSLTGGGGADVFVFGDGSGRDRITDFKPGADQIDLSAIGVAGFAEVLAAAEDTASGVRIDMGALGGGGSLLLEGVQESDLNTDDFIFAIV